MVSNHDNTGIASLRNWSPFFIFATVLCCAYHVFVIYLGKLVITITITITTITTNEVQLADVKSRKLQGHVAKKRVTWSVLGTKNAGKVQTSADVGTAAAMWMPVPGASIPLGSPGPDPTGPGQWWGPPMYGPHRFSMQYSPCY